MNYQDAAVLAEYTGGEIEKQSESDVPPDQTIPEYSVSIPTKNGLSIYLGSCGWFITDGLGEVIYSMDDLKK